jgi:hypothetical protein
MVAQNFTPSAAEPRRRDFTNARSNAKRRGISWDLTFEEWASVWAASGKYAQRGRRHGEYQMDRRVSEIGYCIGNVQIIVGEKNRTKDMPHGARPKLTVDDVRAIRRDYKPRVVMKKDLAARFGVSVACIKAVLSQMNWKSA